MNFASPYIYANVEPEFEFVSDEEYDHGMEVSNSGSSDDEDEDDSKSVPAPSCSVLPPLPPGRAEQKKGKKIFSWKKACSTNDVTESAPRHRSAPTHAPKSRKFRRADTNVVSIRLNELVAPSNMHAGDPVYCTQCQAILSKLAQIVSDGTDKVWQCNFCGERNLVDVEEEEIPQMDDVTFLIEPAPATQATGVSGREESLVIFCVDVSGSMCVTTEVPGKLRLRGSGGLKRMQSLNDSHEDQFLPRQKRDVTYVSRLQSVQAAVDHQLEEMQKDHPNRRVGLITFDNEVTVIGDGTEEETSVAGDKLTNREALVKLGKDLNTPKSIKETRKCLGDKLFSLEEGGATALGPTLVVAVAMASRHPGSKVILCTDGMANVGMGKLDDSMPDSDTGGFYENISAQAMDQGVSISVVTIKGTDCKLVELGKLADKTGGQVNIVDPLKLTQEFSTILADRTIATNVVATFNLHKQLYIHHENNDKKESRSVREVGNVTCDTEITFEYGVRPENVESKTAKEDKSEMMLSKVMEEVKTEAGAVPDANAVSEGGAEPDAVPTADTVADVEVTATSSTSAGGGPEPKSVPAELPFQLQIRYTDTEGMKALRVLTQTKPVTHDRDLAEKNIDLNVLGTHAAQKTANLALEGEYTMSRGAALMNQRLAWRSAQRAEGGPDKKAWYRRIFSKIQTVENHVSKAQMSERSRRGTTYSDEEYEDDEPISFAPEKAKKKKVKKIRARTSEVEDDMANAVYAQSRISSNKLN
ncbi:circularly permutated Ras protein 1-like isoform X1 [Haliotis rufescens]|uniref:circularly permutated Ras protein 1-like isoform X1 n=1 Tax=Haliotis rufescens TaxID=6454 RepID=UPI001EB02CCD|nr:circularly permutated Ras protein 1-like isoform X1 [Haliotis rufescens]